MRTLAQREDRLPYGIDITIVDSTSGPWWLVYDQSEGFQPLTYAVRTDDAGCAQEVREEQERNQDRDTEQLVVVPLRRNLPIRDLDSGRYLSLQEPLEEPHLEALDA